MSDWQPIETAPEGKWLLTCRQGETRANITFYRKLVPLDSRYDAEDAEWIDQEGRTTVTHHSFAMPTHWLPLPEPPK